MQWHTSGSGDVSLHDSRRRVVTAARGSARRSRSRPAARAATFRACGPAAASAPPRPTTTRRAAATAAAATPARASARCVEWRGEDVARAYVCQDLAPPNHSPQLSCLDVSISPAARRRVRVGVAAAAHDRRGRHARRTRVERAAARVRLGGRARARARRGARERHEGGRGTGIASTCRHLFVTQKEETRAWPSTCRHHFVTQKEETRTWPAPAVTSSGSLSITVMRALDERTWCST